MSQARVLSNYPNASLTNKIINGCMRVDQRNSGASVTPASGAYTLDRWVYNASQASKVTIQQNAGSVTPPAGFTNYLGLTVSASANVTIGAGDYFDLEQRIEGFNASDLSWGTANAKPVTLSFWVRSSLTGSFGGSLRNSGSSRSYPFSYSISSANTWEQKFITIAGDTSGTWLSTNGVGIYVGLALGYGSTYGNGTAGAWVGGDVESVTGSVSVVSTNSATFYITGVDLRKGSYSTAPTFDMRQYGQELALCQRYFISTLNDSTSKVGFCGAGYGNYSMYGGAHSFPVQMRATPSSTVYRYGHGADFSTFGDGTAGRFIAYAFNNVNIQPTSTYGAALLCTARGIVMGSLGDNTSANTVYQCGYTASAEL